MALCRWRVYFSGRWYGSADSVAVVICRIIRIERSTRAVCSPGGDVWRVIPSEPSGSASDLFTISQSPCSVWTRWRFELYVMDMMCCRALKMAGVDFEEEPITVMCPVNSSTSIISCECMPGDGSGCSCGSKLRTAPTEVAGALTEGGWEGLRCLPAAQ